MTEDPSGVEESRPRESRPMRRGRLAVCILALGVLYLCVVAYSRSLVKDARRDLESELDSFGASTPTDRPRLVGERSAGNAAYHYRAIEWVLQPRDSWEYEAPEIAPTMGKDHPAMMGLELPRKLDLPLDGSPLNETQADFVATYGQLTKHVRDGLASDRCAWILDLDEGLEAEIPGIFPYPLVAELMAYEAGIAEPTEGVRIGLEIVAFAQDLRLHPSVTVQLIGGGVEAIGIKSLQHTLMRPLPEADLQRIMDALGSATPIDLTWSLEHRRLGSKLTALALAEKPEDGEPQLSFMSTWCVYELWGLDRYFGKLNGARKIRNYSQRVQAHDGFEREVASAPFYVVRLLLPNQIGAETNVDRGMARRHMTRMLAAAHLYRLKNGGFPKNEMAVAEFFGGQVPDDPFAVKGSPLTLTLVGEEVVCGSKLYDLYPKLEKWRPKTRAPAE